MNSQGITQSDLIPCIAGARRPTFQPCFDNPLGSSGYHNGLLGELSSLIPHRVWNSSRHMWEPRTLPPSLRCGSTPASWHPDQGKRGLLSNIIYFFYFKLIRVCWWCANMFYRRDYEIMNRKYCFQETLQCSKLVFTINKKYFKCR